MFLIVKPYCFVNTSSGKPPPLNPPNYLYSLQLQLEHRKTMINKAKTFYNTGKFIGQSKADGMIGRVMGSVFGLIMLAYLLPIGYTQIQSQNLSEIPGGEFIATGAYALVSLAAGFGLVFNIVDALGFDKLMDN